MGQKILDLAGWMWWPTAGPSRSITARARATAWGEPMSVPSSAWKVLRILNIFYADDGILLKKVRTFMGESVQDRLNNKTEKQHGGIITFLGSLLALEVVGAVHEGRGGCHRRCD